MIDTVVAAHNRAVALRQAERFDDALQAIEAALRGGPPRPETRTMHAHILADAGRFDEAVSVYQALLADHPELTDVHETLATLLPQVGRSGEALDSYRKALAQRPDVGMLWVTAMAMARGMNDWPALLGFAHDAEARFGNDTMITVYRALALSGLDRDADALDVLTPAIKIEPDYGPAHTTLAHILTRLGDYAAAEPAALRATALDGCDQAAWALLTAIWRAKNDAREEWLANYDQHVMTQSVDGIDWNALTHNLNTRHQMMAAPGDQSLRGGTQTRGTLFDSPDAEIVTLKRAVESAVNRALSGMAHDEGHPFAGRMTGRVILKGSWSVRLASQGFHISHIHPQGWLSSALYVSLPPEIGQGDAGALGFGRPDAALKLDMPPRRIVQPDLGKLILFPSYFWHGTLPFESSSSRLSVAFDAVPA